MTLAIVARNAAKAVQRNSPIILTGLAIAGVISTVALSVRGTVKAVKLIDEMEDVPSEVNPNGIEHRFTRIEKARILWPVFVPAAATGLVTIACIIGAQSINARRQSALIGAFAITEQAFQDYQSQVVEQIGTSKEDKIKTGVAQKRVDDNPPENDMLVLPHGKVLVLDLFTGRYFHSTMETIRSAMNDVNYRITTDGESYVSLNEFYIILGLEPGVIGDIMGFSSNNLMDIDFNTAIVDPRIIEGGVPCLTISFRALPTSDYNSLR